MARARRRSACPSGLDPLRVNRSHFARRSVAAACPHRAHRLERFEPYEGKLSSTVLRGGRAGNSPPPLDPRAWLISDCRYGPRNPLPGRHARTTGRPCGGRSGRWIVPDTQVALHSTRPSRRLDYAGVMAFSPANRKEPSYSPGRTVSGGNMTFSRTDPFTDAVY